MRATFRMANATPADSAQDNVEGMILALLTLLGSASEPRSDTVRSGTARERVAVDDADLVVFYTSEHRGKLGTCGCSANPRGGLARLDGYLDLVERHGPGTPSILVHAGRWASDRIGDTVDLTADALVQNAAIHAAMVEAGFDALNLTFRDTPWVRTAPVPELAVTANAGEGFRPFTVIEAGERSVAVVGVGRAGSPYLQPEAATWRDPLEALEEVLPQVAEQSDLVVVLAYETGTDTQRIARLDGVDVVIEAGGYQGKEIPWVESGTVWVQSRDEAQSVGELRLWLDDDGAIEAVHDRWVDLDHRMPESPVLRRLERRTERDRLRALTAAGLAE